MAVRRRDLGSKDARKIVKIAKKRGVCWFTAPGDHLTKTVLQDVVQYSIDRQYIVIQMSENGTVDRIRNAGSATAGCPYALIALPKPKKKSN